MDTSKTDFMSTFFGTGKELRIKGDYEEFKKYKIAVSIVKATHKDSDIEISLGADEEGEFISLKGYDDVTLLKLGLFKGTLKE